MSDTPLVDVPPAPAAPPAYSRARCLLNIIEFASMQLRQDADKLEQEDLALASRVQAILMQCGVISANDPLLK